MSYVFRFRGLLVASNEVDKQEACVGLKYNLYLCIQDLIMAGKQLGY